MGYLTKINAVVRWVSVEPLLGPADLSKYLPALDWIIVGGGGEVSGSETAWWKKRNVNKQLSFTRNRRWR